MREQTMFTDHGVSDTKKRLNSSGGSLTSSNSEQDSLRKQASLGPHSGHAQVLRWEGVKSVSHEVVGDACERKHCT